MDPELGVMEPKDFHDLMVHMGNEEEMSYDDVVELIFGNPKYARYIIPTDPEDPDVVVGEGYYE